MRYLAIILLSFFITSCVTNNVKTINNKIQNQWELASIKGKDVVSEKPVFLSFNQNKISGFIGCNTLNGNYDFASNDNLKFNQLATTRMMCDPKSMEIENNILKTLNGSQSVNILNNQLIIKSDGSELVFNKVNNTNIIEKYWKLIELNGNAAEMAENQEREQYFILKSDNSINGFAGCNRMMGQYDLEENKLSFKQNMATTMKACIDIDVNESEFLNALNKTHHYKVKNKQLYLYSKNKNLLAVFESVVF